MTSTIKETRGSRGVKAQQSMSDLASKGYKHPSNATVAGSTVTDAVWARAKEEELGWKPVANYELVSKGEGQVSEDFMDNQGDFCHNTPSELDNIELDDLSQQDLFN